MDMDTLFQNVARQMTRRGALATVVSGMLLARDAASIDANARARRRRNRTKQKNNRCPSPFRLKPIWIWVQNRGTKEVTLAHGDGANCCYVLNEGVRVLPGARVAVSSGYNENCNYTRGFVWINEKFWLSFDNAVGQRPDVTAALNGQPPGDRFCCLPPPAGQHLLHDAPMTIGQKRSITMDGHVFEVTRERNTNYIVFTVALPATL